MYYLTFMASICIAAGSLLTAVAQESNPVAWSIALGNGDAAPIVSRDRIFVVDSAFAESGEEAFRIQSLEPSSGKAIWKQTLAEKSYNSQDISDRFPVRPIANPILIGDRIISLSYGGIASCLNAADGKLVWQCDLVEHHQAIPLQFGWCTSPWSDGKVVVLACGGPAGILIALDVESGDLLWEAGQGLQAAYGSIAELAVEGGEKHLCYLGQDELVGIDKSNGNLLWKYPLAKPGMTNTVTPIALGDSRLLVSGQGLSSTHLLYVHKSGGQWQVESKWQSTKLIPFYCNWLVDQDSQTVFGFASGRLTALNIEEGKSQWMQRGWTDANFVKVGEKILAVRGDGFMGLCELGDQGLRLTNGARIANDRIWATPLVCENKAFLRGRNSLTVVDIERLPELSELPSGTEVDSMTAMYGKQHEKMVELVTLAKSKPQEFRYEDYQAIVQDRSIRFGDKEYVQIIDAHQELPKSELLKVTQDWVRRMPESIVAFDRLTGILEKVGQNGLSAKLKQSRYVDVQVEVRVPGGANRPDAVYLSGNAASVGSWKPDGVKLSGPVDGVYRGSLTIPTGDFEFKITQGNWDSEEARMDGRAISNRRRRILQPMTVTATVQTWKSTAKKETN